MTLTKPLRLIILHLSHSRLTEALTFTATSCVQAKANELAEHLLDRGKNLIDRSNALDFSQKAFTLIEFD